ncbi:hypothetical protein [Pseudomonas sp. 18175]|uniref:hypothetical protein n=1 Tax=Pseudomonas sp. 18175 TaxID=3390056 RepID=UPI003D1A7BAC
MAAQKPPAATKAAAKPTTSKAKAAPKTPAKPKPVSAPKKPATAKNLLKLKLKKNPKNLDRLSIPGMTENVDGYDGGIPAWLFESGLTFRVDKNWKAKVGDVITVGKLITPTTIEPLAVKKLVAGEEAHNFYFFSTEQKNLPDGPHALVYAVSYGDGSGDDLSYVLEVFVRTELPAGDDDDQVKPGHSGIDFSVSETVIVPGNAHTVKVTVQPYKNVHPLDKIILHWGHVIITQPVAGAINPTVIPVTYQDIVDGGDGKRNEVWLEIIDLVGNVSTPGSAGIFVSVTLDTSKPDGPIPVNAGPSGYIDLEVVDEKPLELQMFTPSNIGLRNDIYDVTCRFYPPKGGIKVVHKYVPITTAGRPVSAFFDYLDVRAAAEGRIDTSFVLRRGAAPFEIYSKKTTAQVKGSIVRLADPSIEGYPSDVIGDDPEHVIASIPYYAWRHAADKISLILRYVRALNDVIVHIDTQPVGLSIPDGAPVRRVITRAQLQMFKGYRPELYYVIDTGFTKARAVDLNESLRRVITII